MGSNIRLTSGDVSLRIIRKSDAKSLEMLVLSNRPWLRPWEATNPESPQSFDFRVMVRTLFRQFERQTVVPFVIEVDQEVVGQINVANVLYGAVSSAVIGYWVIPEVAGRGVTPTAVALTTDYLMKDLGLHRVEINIVPENAKSLRVVEKLGFRFEGLKQKYIHINGAWRDHYVFALTSEDLKEGVLERWQKGNVPKLEYPWQTRS